MGRSTIRTAPQTSGKPRRRKWTLRALTTLVLTAGSLASLAGPAQAYDDSTCKELFGENLVDVDPIRLDTKYVDFGDLPHTGPVGGAPQAKGVVCWTADQYAVVGRLFYDSPPPDHGTAWARFYDSGTGEWVYLYIDPTPGELTYDTLEYISPPSSDSTFELRLWWKTPTSTQLSGEAEAYRGGP